MWTERLRPGAASYKWTLNGTTIPRKVGFGADASTGTLEPAKPGSMALRAFASKLSTMPPFTITREVATSGGLPARGQLQGSGGRLPRPD